MSEELQISVLVENDCEWIDSQQPLDLMSGTLRNLNLNPKSVITVSVVILPNLANLRIPLTLRAV